LRKVNAAGNSPRIVAAQSIKCRGGFSMRKYVGPTSLVAALILGGCSAESGVEVAGRYEYSTDAASLASYGNVVCFQPSDTSAQGGPDSAFCFENDAEARQLLGIQPLNSGCRLSGEATVRIAGYESRLGDGVDTATLISVPKKSAARMMACP
jgi:hypothetical protein